MNSIHSEFSHNHFTSLIITDNEYNIIYKNQLLSNSIDLGKTTNLLDTFPDLSLLGNDITTKQFLNKSIFNITKSSIILDSKPYYSIIISDCVYIEEIFNQVDLLNEQNHLYLEMFNKLQDGIFITDDIGKTIYVNDSFISLSNLEKKQVLGKTVYDLMDKNIVPNSCCAKVLKTKKKVSTINSYYGARKCLVSGSPIFDKKGNLSNTIAVIRDVSELDLLMKELVNEKTMTLIYKNKIDKIESFKKLEKRELYKELTVTRSKTMEDVYEQAYRIADYDSTVLIQGETGVGKDFFAKYIHNISIYSDNGSYVKINCASIPDTLLESELFGYEKGAFSGANNNGKVGLFEKANNGTLFLDEIGEMPIHLQSKLLNALNDKEFLKLGGTTPISFNARIIAATNANLVELIHDNKFRLDLFYRLNVINITMPPLRERIEDILLLSMYFLNLYNNKYIHNCYFSPEILESFIKHTWPGNIRELKNMIEKLVLTAKSDCINSDLFSPQLINNTLNTSMPEKYIFIGTTLKEKLESYEKTLINVSIDSTKTLNDAAKLLGIDLSTLVRKKRKYKIYKRKKNKNI